MNWITIRIIDAYIGTPLLYALACLRKAYRRRKPAAVRPIRKILLVKFWGIGNIFMMLPSLTGLRKTFPGAEIEILTLGTNRAAAECVGAFSATHTVDTAGYLRFLRTTLAALVSLRRRNYDLIIDFEQFARYSALFVALIGKSVTIGFNTESQHRHFLFSRPVNYDNGIHIVRSYYSLVEAAGMPADYSSIPPVLLLPDGATTDDILAKLRVRPDRTIVVFHVGTSSNFSERRWPAAHYAALADRLIENHDVQIVLTGLPEEKYIAAEVLARVRFRNNVADASGKLNFQDYFDLIRASDLVVSADTAAVHIASAAAIPVVGFYGPNTPLLYGPWGKGGLSFYGKLDCSPCITNFNAKTHTCGHPEGKGTCMRKIGPEEVYEEVRRKFIENSPARKPKRSEGSTSCTR